MSEDTPFVVDRDTGVITTAGIFRGQSGNTLTAQVGAFDNYGMPPTLSTTATFSVSVCLKYIILASELLQYIKLTGYNIHQLIRALLSWYLLQALVYKCGEQIELSFAMQREVIEAGIDMITR